MLCTSGELRLKPASNCSVSLVMRSALSDSHVTDSMIKLGAPYRYDPLTVRGDSP